MDGREFDRLTRGLAARTDRRGALRSVAAGAAAALLARAGMAPAAAQEGGRDCPDGCRNGQTCVDGVCMDRCREDKECRERGGDACIGGRCTDGVCSQFVAECEPGYVCCGNGECCPQSCDLDLDCTLADPCVVGRCEEGACAYTRREPCVRCASDADCSAEGICCGGTCLRPCPEGTRLTKGCECLVVSTGGMNADGIAVTDEAAGADNQRPSNSDPNPPIISDGRNIVVEAPPATTTVSEPPTVSTGVPSSSEAAPVEEAPVEVAPVEEAPAPEGEPAA